MDTNQSNSGFSLKRLFLGTFLGGIGMVIIAVGILGYLTVKSLTGPSTGGGAPHFSINSGSLFGNSFNHDEFFPDTGDVAILNVTGVIFKSRPIIERIEELGEKKDLKAVVVRIDSPGGAVGRTAGIGHGTRRTVRHRQRHGGRDVQSHHPEQTEARAPDQAGLGFQEMRVGVDQVRIPEHLEVAHQVPDHESKERDAGDGHHVLLPERRSPDAGQQVHLR